MNINKEHYLNREFGLLEFNRRVLAQAAVPSVPLLERLKFLCIVSSNLDEFFEIRVASLKEQDKLNLPTGEPDGLMARQVYSLVSNTAHEIVDYQYRLFNDEIVPALAEQGIRFLRRADWNDIQREWIRDYFFKELMPVLTPIGLDPAHPFPRVINKSLNFAVELEGRDAFGRNSGVAIVKAPRILPRFINLPIEIAASKNHFVFLSSILHAHIQELFAGMQVVGCYQFRVTRNSDLFVDEEEVKDLKLALQGELSHRHFGNAVRLEVADNCSGKMADFLLQQFDLTHEDLYRVNGPVNLVRLMQVPDRVERPDLKFPAFIPSTPAILKKSPDIFQAIRNSDILLHHPFQSFLSVIEFIQQAATDPQVIAIKQTVYRTGADSIMMEALINAARHGKEVTVIVELLARFDEEANINWAARLEEAGAHVVYGVVGHKTHAKMALVIRKEENYLARYAHLGTGNYHSGTTKLYTDFGLFTANQELCADVNEIFLQLTGLGKAAKLTHLWQAPFSLHTQLIIAINKEKAHAEAGRRGHIIAKMNALLDKEIIHALYEASQAGVKIDLIVRGVCSLRPRVPGLSDNIRVRSIIGRFLEHSRIFYFRDNGAHNVYLASADWMPRNFFRRIEICFPILDNRLKKRIIREGLKPYLADNMQAWEMQPDGYYRLKSGQRHKETSAQLNLLEELATISK